MVTDFLASAAPCGHKNVKSSTAQGDSGQHTLIIIMSPHIWVSSGVYGVQAWKTTPEVDLSRFVRVMSGRITFLYRRIEFAWRRWFYVTPVHKKGPVNVLTKYRSISVPCVPCKLLERIVVWKSS